MHRLVVPHSHNAADAVDDALTASAAGIRAVKISLVILGVTALLQLAVFAVSGSVALLADTIHNFSDALTALPLWAAFALGRRKASRRYTYGYGRVEDLAGLFIVGMIALSAMVAGYEAIIRLAQPRPLANLGLVLAAGLIGFVGNELVAVYRIRVGRRIGSAALVADGLHARTDGFTSVAVVLVGAARDIGRRLLDSVDPQLVSTAEQAVQSLAGIETVEDLRMRWTGHRLKRRGHCHHRPGHGCRPVPRTRTPSRRPASSPASPCRTVRLTPVAHPRPRGT